MPNYTENIQLEKPLASEFYDVGVFNDNADKIDAAVRSLQQGKATVEASVAALQETHAQDVQELNQMIEEVQATAAAALPAADYTADDILVKLKSVDGSGSGLDADLFKGNSTVPIENGGTGATTAAEALAHLGVTATAEELNYSDGVTSNIQTQLDHKWNYSIIDTATDLNNITSSGVYSIKVAGCTNAPVSHWGTLIVDGDTGSPYQLYIPDGDRVVIYKRKFSGTWSILNSGDPYLIGAIPLRHTVIGWGTPSTGSETAPIWLKLGEINCSGTYFTYTCLLAVNIGAGGDVAKLAITVRTEDTSGVLSVGTSAIIVDVSSLRVSSTLRNADRFVIDNSVTGKAVLYYKCWGNYPMLAARVLHEQFSTSRPMSNSEKLQLVKNNYQGSFSNLVLGTDYETSITQTIVGKSPVTNLSNSNSLPLDTSFVLSRDLRYFTNRGTKVTASETGQEAMMRGIKLQTTDMTAGTTALTNGQICLVYE